jgi:hypothetical protein
MRFARGIRMALSALVLTGRAARENRSLEPEDRR